MTTSKLFIYRFKENGVDYSDDDAYYPKSNGDGSGSGTGQDYSDNWASGDDYEDEEDEEKEKEKEEDDEEKDKEKDEGGAKDDEVIYESSTEAEGGCSLMPFIKI